MKVLGDNIDTPIIHNFKAKDATTMSKGTPVCIDPNAKVVKSNGTVASNNFTGTANAFSAAGTWMGYGICYDKKGRRMIVAYKDATNGAGSGAGSYIVGRCNDVDPAYTSTFTGTGTVFHAGNIGTNIAACYEPEADKVVLAFADADDTHKGKVMVGSIPNDGDTITFGSEIVFDAAQITNGAERGIDMDYDPINIKIIIGYIKNSKPHIVVGTVSGTTATFSHPLQLSTGNTNTVRVCFGNTLDENNNRDTSYARVPRVVVLHDTVQNYLRATVCKIEGDEITKGSNIDVSLTKHSTNVTAQSYDIAFSPVASKWLIGFLENVSGYVTSSASVRAIGLSEATKDYLELEVGDILSLKDTSDQNGTYNAVTYSPVSEKFAYFHVEYDASGQSYGYVDAVSVTDGMGDLTCTKSGNTGTFEVGFAKYIAAAYDEDTSRHMVVYTDNDNSNLGTAGLFQIERNAQGPENFIGMTKNVMNTPQVYTNGPIPVVTRGGVALGYLAISGGSSGDIEEGEAYFRQTGTSNIIKGSIELKHETDYLPSKSYIGIGINGDEILVKG